MTRISNRPQPGRHNMYYGIHKGMRLGHARNLERLSATDWADPAARDATLKQLRAYLALARGHLNSEETKIHPAIEAAEPGSSAIAHEGHDHHDTALADLEQHIRTVERASEAGSGAAGHALYLAYAGFVAADLEHMADEETDLLGAMHRLFTDEELHDIETRLVAAIPPALMAGYMGLIVPALSAPERAGMLGGLRQAMPPEVFSGLLDGAVLPALAPADADRLIADLGLALRAAS